MNKVEIIFLLLVIFKKTENSTIEPFLMEPKKLYISDEDMRHVRNHEQQIKS